jgi:hypothetical protein
VLWYQNSNDTELWYIPGLSYAEGNPEIIQSYDYFTRLDWGLAIHIRQNIPICGITTEPMHRRGSSI